MKDYYYIETNKRSFGVIAETPKKAIEVANKLIKDSDEKVTIFHTLKMFHENSKL